MSEENEFIDWQGGECPVDSETVVEVKFTGGGKTTAGRPAGVFNWQRRNIGGDIIAYRVVEPPKPEIPEGFTPWAGGAMPVDPATEIDVVLRNGETGSWTAGDVTWMDRGYEHDIIAYRVIEDKKPQSARDIQVGGDHYKKAGVQTWDVVDTWPIEQQIGFHRGNALKYVMRMGTKDENLREIRKAAHYLQKLVEVLEQKGGV